MPLQILEGTGEEVASQGEALSGRRVRLIVLPDQDRASQGPELPLALPATPEEVIAALDALAEQNRGLPVLPPEAFERESLYADDEDCKMKRPLLKSEVTARSLRRSRPLRETGAASGLRRGSPRCAPPSLRSR
jgi:hypothetical protein